MTIVQNGAMTPSADIHVPDFLRSRVLVVEDDSALRTVLVENLQGVGFDVEGVGTGRSALAALHEAGADVVVLDIGLPDMSGTAVCEAVRRAFPGVAVLMLTARGEIHARIAGFEAGADDYVVKPFALRELNARIHALLRRSGHAATDEPLTVGSLRCDIAERRAWRDDHELHLSRQEFDLVALLMRKAGVVLSRHTLLSSIWAADEDAESNVVDQAIKRLREKVDRPFGTHSIETVRGIGYRITRDA
ncbi:MAG: two component heavy metal response transcriptional regulator, winged helix family [Thermoleophilia bacterium]|nr:two component heavy metal response transcriptional regulator, winged helix family [Thermoleophilia bacterium]